MLSCMPKCWGVCAQQPTSLNGSLGTIPHTDSQSHISPPPHQPETQVHIHASQDPMCGSLMSGHYDQRCHGSGCSCSTYRSAECEAKHCKQRQCQASKTLPSEGLCTLEIDLPTSTSLPTRASKVVNAGVAGSSDWGARWAGGSRPQPGRRRQHAAPQLRQPPGPAGRSVSRFRGIAAQGIIRDHASWTAEDIRILGVARPSHAIAENQPRWCRQRHECCKSQQIAA